jgi:hypothetical protein
MDYHQSIAATCEQTMAVLSATLSAHGYRLERSFNLRSVRHAVQSNHDQYLVLLAYEQTAATPPLVITAYESRGVTHLQIEGCPLSAAVEAAFEEMSGSLLDTA